MKKRCMTANVKSRLHKEMRLADETMGKVLSMMKNNPDIDWEDTVGTMDDIENTRAVLAEIDEYIREIPICD